MIDFDRPVRARQLHEDATYPVEILRANLPTPYIAVGLVGYPAAKGKGLDQVVKLFDALGVAEDGTRIENYEPTVAPFAPRTLRLTEPGITFQTRSGFDAVFRGANGVDLDWEIVYETGSLGAPGTTGYVTTDDKGRVVEPRPQNAADLDIREVCPERTRFVRVYDKAKTSKNPSRCDNWYEFDSLAEAQANMQGVRAIATVTYREGDNFPCPE
jgi:hypothetical protein